MFLWFLALLDILYGYSLLATPLPLRDRLDLILPWPVWAWIWLGVGTFLIPGAFVRGDRWFFAAAALIKAFWAVAWISVWLLDPQVPRAWVSVVIWGAFSGVVVLVATWPEVKRVPGGGE